MEKEKAMKAAICVALFTVVLFSSGLTVADEIRPSPIGVGIGSVLSGGVPSNQDFGITNGISTKAVIEASQLVGLYVLHSFNVTFDSGLVIDSGDYQFSGDMAITSNNTIWQRIDIIGFPVVTASGSFVISDNTMTISNDLITGTSVASLSWDGTFLTTEVNVDSVPDPFTEIDVWKRVLSSSDQDNDGVVDEWDDCPGTSSPCVNNKGCRCTTSNPAIPMLLLDE